MAHVTKRGKKWYGSWMDHRGERTRRVLRGVTTRREAQEIANAREAHATRVRAGLASELDNSAKLAPLVEGFLLDKISTRRYPTVRHYRTALAGTVGGFTTDDGRTWPPPQAVDAQTARRIPRKFGVGALAAQHVHEITPARINAFVAARRATMAVRTLNIRIQALKALLKWAVRHGEIKSNPIADMERAGAPAKSERALTPWELARLLAVSPEPYRAIWHTFASTGMRAGELIRLRWPAVAISVAPPTISILPETTKSKAAREIPVEPTLLPHLLALRAKAADLAGPVFTDAHGKPLRYNLGRVFRRCLERALVGEVHKVGRTWSVVWQDEHGEHCEDLPDARTRREAKAALLERRDDLVEGVTLHTLRHTFATALIRSGQPITVVSKLLGHKDVSTTLNIYSHVFKDDKIAAVEALPWAGAGEASAVKEEERGSDAGDGGWGRMVG